LQYAETAYGADANCPEVRLCLAGLVASTDPCRSIALLKDAVFDDGFATARAEGVLITAHLGNGQPDLALEIARRLARRSPDAGYDSLLAEVGFHAADMDFAVRHSRRALGDDALPSPDVIACVRILIAAGTRDIAIKVLRRRLETCGGTEAEWQLLAVPDTPS